MMMVLMILMLRCPHHELLLAPVFCPAVRISAGDDPSVSQSVFTITEMAPTRAFFWLKATTRAFTFKTLLRHYAKQTLTPQ